MKNERIEREIRAGFFMFGLFGLIGLVAWYFYFSPPPLVPDMTEPSPFKTFNTAMKIGWERLGFYGYPLLNPVWISVVSLGILAFTLMQRRNRICLWSSNTGVPAPR